MAKNITVLKTAVMRSGRRYIVHADTEGTGVNYGGLRHSRSTFKASRVPRLIAKCDAYCARKNAAELAAQSRLDQVLATTHLAAS